MKSPNGTNFAGLLVDANHVGAAYDEKLPDDSTAALHEFLKDKLTPEDLARFCELAGIDASAAMDDRDDDRPQPLKGMPEPGGTMFGQDGARSQDARVRTLAARIRENA
jgi:hypothetical protein